MSCLAIVKVWIRIMYPWVGARSFDDLYERLFVPVNGFSWSPSSLITYSLPVTWGLSVIAKAFILPVAPGAKYHWLFGYSKQSLGLIGRSAWMATGFALTEVICIRLWLTMVNHKRTPSYKLLLQDLYREDKRIYHLFLTTSKLACWSMAIFAAFLFIWLHFIPLKDFVEISDVKSVVSCFVWIIISSIAPFYAGPDVATIFVLAIACYYIIHRKARMMIEALGRSKRIDRPFLQKYFQVLNMIQQLAPLSGILMLIADILIIPTYSVVLFTLNIDGSINQLILKVILLAIGSVYAVRAYALTAVFSGVESQSKRLHSTLCSILARDRTLNSQVKLLIRNYILEDLGSVKKHMCVREYGVYTVNQMDLLNSILGTWQVILLIFDFRNTVTL